ncbi:MAG TPA: amino acid permease, partial [Trebonia sp.]|nr:amino acid permease [Trebonia sp.]
MHEATPQSTAATDSDDARLESLGYRPQLSRVLGLFANFSVAFTYLSPMVGIYSLFLLGVGTGGPGYVWTTWIPVAGMLLVALVFGELASHYPIAGALYQYSKYNVGRRYGWFVGWFYGIALLVTVASVDTGVVAFVAALLKNWFNWNLNPTSHATILVITLVLLLIQTTVNITGAKVMGRVAQAGVYVEILGTVGIAIVLAIHGFHHGVGYLFSSQGVQNAKTNPLGLDFHGSYFGALVIAVLAPVYIFYGFESAGDISEETKDAGRPVPRAMRHALIWGGVASFIVIAALLLSIPAKGGFAGAIGSTLGAVPYILSQLPSAIQDIALLLLIFAFFSCGSSIQGAGSRLMFSYARDGALPAAKWISTVHSRFKTPVNALLSGAVVTALFVLLEFASP